MNIDTLKRADGTFRKANVGDIKRMLSADHVTHIQTERGTIAIRPGRRAVDSNPENAERGWTVDRAVAGGRLQSKWFRHGEQVRLIRAVILFLNGTLHGFEAGHDCVVYANQADRDAYVLAVLGQQVLVEYEMPAGTTALVLYSAIGNMLTRIKTIPHLALGQRWVDAIHEQGYAHLWIGKGQRRQSHEPVPLPPASGVAA